MKKILVGFIAVIALLLGLAASCDSITQATDAITNATPRQIYKRDFKNDTIFYPRWEEAFKVTLKDDVAITLPYVEKGFFVPNKMVGYGYEVALQKGEILNIQIITDSLNHRVFIDLYEKSNDSIYTFVSRSDLDEKRLDFAVKKSADYKIVAQPEIEANTPFAIQIYRTPSYIFPVAGKGNAAIQSFWGAARDGGRRQHEGVDIFASRGTPVVAAADGWVRNTGNRGLGGKQVWLRTGLFGHSLYYAHLDSIAVSSGSRVKVGDTLGFVGNTGNARTTAPHLHFGIYERGAINPLPFIHEAEEFESNLATIFETDQARVTSSKANLRASSHIRAKKIGEAKRNDTLHVLGKTDNWIHIQTKEKTVAYLHESLIEPLK